MALPRLESININFLYHPLSKLVISATILLTVSKIAYVFLSRLSEDIYSYYSDPKIWSYENRVLLLRKAIYSWKQNHNNKIIFNKLSTAIAKVVYHSFFLFIHGRQLGRKADTVDKWQKNLQKISDIKNNKENSELTNKQEDIETILNDLLSLLNIEDNQSDKLVASHELKKLENEGKDYLIQPLVRLRALKAINIALSWYLTLEWNYPLNEKTVTLEEEYDNEFTNNLFWDCFTNKNNDSTLRTSLLFK